ncbi:MAG: hypothetical protein JNK23_07915 [Opitutaceae bacterium]|nr:hypothetical protein [Opitutaceae bacterium]
MKRLRLLLLAAGAGLLLLVALVLLVLAPWFQTWAVRRALPAQGDFQASIGSVAAGLKRTEIRDLRLGYRGATVVLPLVELEVPMAEAGWNRRVIVTRLVARDWTMEFAAAGTPGAAPAAPATAAETARISAEAAVGAFVGVFAQLDLPIDVVIDGVELAGEVVLPEARGRVKVTIQGGGLAAGREAKFAVTAIATLATGDVQSVELRGELAARMDTPRTFAALGVTLDATAVGPNFPGGVRLRTEARAARSAAGERYTASAVSDGREIVALSAEYPAGARRIDGRWSIKARDADLAPFTFGKTLPVFSVAGEGSFDADAGFIAAHAAGHIDATADRLGVVQAELAELGPVSLRASFDFAHSGRAIVVRQFEGNFGAGDPVATLRLLQEFEINPGTGELRTAEVAKDLVAITLHGAPLAWARPWLGGLDPRAGRLRGDLVATPRNGGVTLRSPAPLAVADFALFEGERPLIEPSALIVSVAADYTPQGWQVEIPGLALRTGDEVMLTFSARAGRLAGQNQPVKATGRLNVDLPRVLAQPVASGYLALATGEAEINFAATLAARREVHANLAIKNLAARTAGEPLVLPALTMDLRADAGPDGATVFSAPILIERAGRKSDFAINGTLTPVDGAPPLIEALVAGTQVFIEDMKLLGAAAPLAPDKPAAAAGPVPPPWAGLNGAVTLRFNEVIWSPGLSASNVTGRIRIDAGQVKLEGLQASVGEAGKANIAGAVTFANGADRPYVLAADVRLKDIDSGPIWRALNGDRVAPLEGRFDVASEVAAQAGSLATLADAAIGEFAVTSRGGVFRGLPLNVTQAVESSGRLASILASIGSLTGRKAGSDIAGKAEAVAEFVRAMHPLAYDQLNVRVRRDAALNMALDDFALIAPEVRLTGAGTARHRTGDDILNDELAMEFRLRARGRAAELLKYLGLLEGEPDPLGYTACAVPFAVGGTIGQPDAGDLNRRFSMLAVEKSGVTDKASEFFNKLIGGGK